MSKDRVKLTLVRARTDTRAPLPLASSGIHAGFPSPAENFIEESIYLNKRLIKDPEATFYAWVEGDSMKGDGINDGDLLVIHKTPNPADGDICVCFINGEFTLKRIEHKDGKVFLMPSNESFEPIELLPGDELTVWGKVLASINLFTKL